MLTYDKKSKQPRGLGRGAYRGRGRGRGMPGGRGMGMGGGRGGYGGGGHHGGPGHRPVILSYYSILFSFKVLTVQIRRNCRNQENLAENPYKSSYCEGPYRQLIGI